MKALLKQLVLAASPVLLLLCATGIMAQDNAGFYTVSGVVKDKTNRKKLEYVNISVPGTPIGTVTNEDGEFSLKIKNGEKVEAIEISHIGYCNYRQPIEKENLSGLTFLLTPQTMLLSEIIIRANDARNIVAAAIDNIGNNYPDRSNMLTGFYRETAQKGRRYVNLSEAVINIYKTPYAESVERDRVQVYKGRKLLSQKASDTLAVKLLGGPNLAVYVDIVKNPDILLDKESLSNFSYKMEEPVSIDNRPQYVISFRPQVIQPYALYYGTLYIDKENLAFTRAEFFLDMSDRAKATQMILRKKPLGLRFKPGEVAFLVTYKQRGGKSYLNYIRNQIKFKCDWKRRLFSTNYTIVSEMVVTENTEQNVELIPYKAAFKKNQSLSDKVMDFFDPDFWGAYNIIEPTESLESAVVKLKKQYK